jgi:ATP-dependent Lhr-like helicase
VVAQQMIALVLEYPGRPAHEVVGVARTQFPEFDRESVATVFDFMEAKGVLFISSGLASMGPEGEKLFGRAHFLDLLSAFATPMTLAARHGSTELGDVDPIPARAPAFGAPSLVDLCWWRGKWCLGAQTR